MAKVRSLSIRGFRAFGNEEQTLAFSGPVSVLFGPNSQGKTSLAEAFEFLLTGTISRRTLVSSTTEEFADALRNAHLPAGVDPSVSMTLDAADGREHVVKRVLLEDFGMRSSCRSELSMELPPFRGRVIAFGIRQHLADCARS